MHNSLHLVVCLVCASFLQLLALVLTMNKYGIYATAKSISGKSHTAPRVADFSYPSATQTTLNSQYCHGGMHATVNSDSQCSQPQMTWRPIDPRLFSIVIAACLPATSIGHIHMNTHIQYWACILLAYTRIYLFTNTHIHTVYRTAIALN